MEDVPCCCLDQQHPRHLSCAYPQRPFSATIRNTTIALLSSILSIMDSDSDFVEIQRHEYTVADQLRTSSHKYLPDDVSTQIWMLGEDSYSGNNITRQVTSARGRDGKSRLFDALDSPTTVQQLIAGGEDVNHEDFLGATPLHWLFSQQNPNLESAEIIHRNGGNINSHDYQGNTPLEYAVRHAASAAGVEWLLSKGADPNVKTEQNLLLYALAKGKADIPKVLLEAGADPNSPQHFPPLFHAMGLGRFLDEAVDLLLAHGANPVAVTNGNVTPLAYAVRQSKPCRNLGVMRKVYEQAQRRGTPYTAEQLSKAVSEYRGHGYHRELFEQFLEWNVDVNQKIARKGGGFTRPLIIACGDENADIDAIQHLLSLGADPTFTNHDGETPLHAAILTGAPDTVLFLLETLDAQAIDQANNHGQTALHIACEIIHPSGFRVHQNKRFFFGPRLKKFTKDEIARQLANLTTDQVTAIRHARCIGLAQALLANGASTLAQDAVIGATPLHYACRIGIPELVTALPEACSGTCLKLRDKLGQTPLHWAAKCGRAGAVQALMEWSLTEEDCVNGDDDDDDDEGPYGCHLPHMADEQGRLPIHLAAMKGHDNTLEVLLEYTSARYYEAQDMDGRTPLWYASYWYKDVGVSGCDYYRYDDCAGKLRRKIESARGAVPLYYYAFAALASSLALTVIFRSAIAGAATAAVGQGRSLCVKAWGGVVVTWRCAVAGWRHARDEYCRSHT